MRVWGLFIVLLFINTAQAESLVFKTKGYQYSAVLNQKSIQIDWNKSGFKKNQSSKIKKCWKKKIEKEFAHLRGQIFSKRRERQIGNDIEVSWNKETKSTKMLPRQIEKLDKKFTHFYNLAKLAEGKCIK